MTSDTNAEFHCHIASRDQWLEALMLVFSRESAALQKVKAMQTLVKATSGEVDLDGLIVTVLGGQVVGALWAITTPGQSAVIGTPECLSDLKEEAAVVDLLFSHLDVWMRSKDIQVGQILLDSDSRTEASLFESHGFPAVTNLNYLEASASCFPSSEPESELGFRRYADDDERVLSEIIERTYEQTLDCPRLNGRRAWKDIFEGYHSTGDSGTGAWYLLVLQEQVVGCLLLAEHREINRLEVVYLGVVPEFRGKKFGHQATQFALWQAGQRNQQAVVLAVDSENDPAIKAYRQAGFELWDQRLLLMKFLNNG